MAFNRTMKRKKYFYNILIMTGTFFVVSIISLSAFLYANFNSFGIDMMNKNNQKLLSQASSNVEYMNDYARNFSSSLFVNPTVSNLMYNNDIDIYDTLQNINTIKSFIRSAPFIHSVYVYNGTLDRYYVIGPVTDIIDDPFYDTEISSIFNDISVMPSTSPLVRQVPPINAYSEPVDVYSYLLSDTYANNATKNGLVLNMDISWIFNTVISADPSDTHAESHIMLLSPDGKVLGQSNKEWNPGPSSSEPNFGSVLRQAEASSGYFLDTIRGQKSIVTYSTIEQPNWKIVSITPYKDVSQSINKVKGITILISCMVLAAGIIIAYGMSRVLYSPIGSLWEKIDSILVRMERSRRSGNEFQDMENDLSRTAEMLQALQKYKEDTMSSLTQEYILKLLSGKSFDLARYTESKLPFATDGHLGVIVFKMDAYEKFRTSRPRDEQALLWFALMNIADEIMSESFVCESLYTDESHIVSIVQMRAASRDQNATFDNEVRRLTAVVQSTYREYFKESLSAFITGTDGGLPQIHTAYTEALQLSLKRIRYGHGCLLVGTDSEESLGVFDLTSSSITDLLEALKSGQMSNMTSSFTPIVDRLRHCDHNSIMFTLSHITSSIFNTMNIMEQHGTVKFGIDFVSFHEKVTRIETLDEINPVFYTLFQYVSQKIEEKKDHRYANIVASARAYIEDHYNNKNLSQNSISDMMKLSPVYLGKVFRELTGYTIADCIKEIRLSRAKQLLSSTNYSIDEIIEEIGWGNKKYFSTVFKQQFGVTPMEYRLKSTLLQYPPDKPN